MIEVYQLPRNPDYGNGVFRRRIRLRNLADAVLAEVEDTQHAFRLRLCHDGNAVTAVHAEPLRFPLSTCAGAAAPLQGLIGFALRDAHALRHHLDSRSQCTHLFDLAELALAQVRDGRELCEYDVTIPDEREGRLHLMVSLNGTVLHDWITEGNTVIAPKALAGRAMMAGFYRWAAQQFSGELLRAAVILQRGFFVAQSRRFAMEKVDVAPAASNTVPLGSCFSFQTGVIDGAVRVTGSIRDFSEDTTALLKFL